MCQTHSTARAVAFAPDNLGAASTSGGGILYASFDTRHDQAYAGESSLCSYSMATINEFFNDLVDTCFSSIQTTVPRLEYLLGEPRKCRRFEEIEKEDNIFCYDIEGNSFIDGEDPLLGQHLTSVHGGLLITLCNVHKTSNFVPLMQTLSLRSVRPPSRLPTNVIRKPLFCSELTNRVWSNCRSSTMASTTSKLNTSTSCPPNWAPSSHNWSTIRGNRSSTCSLNEVYCTFPCGRVPFSPLAPLA